MTISSLVAPVLPGAGRAGASGSTSGDSGSLGGGLFAAILAADPSMDLAAALVQGAAASEQGEQPGTGGATGATTGPQSAANGTDVTQVTEVAPEVAEVAEVTAEEDSEAPALPTPDPALLSGRLLGAAQILAAASALPISPVLAATVSAQLTTQPTQPSQPSQPSQPTNRPIPGLAAGGTLAPTGAVAPPTSAVALPVGSEVASAEPTAIGTGAPSPGAPAPDSVPVVLPPAGTADHTVDHTAGNTPASTPTSTPDNTAVTAGDNSTAAGTLQGAPAPAPTATGPQAAGHGVPAHRHTEVTSQVFPQVTSLVSRGDGTRRITLKLSPEALGDVRVVLTVKDGDVHVRMVGSELAQQALRSGAHELHRLLDATGASSTQVVVGDHTSSLDAGLQNGSSRQAQGDAQDHRTAGTRDGDTSARDGSTGGSHQRSATDPVATPGAVTRTLSGVDVKM